MVQYIEAAKRPFRNGKKLLIGILLSLFPIVNLFSIGYIMLAAKSSMLGDYRLPEWRNFKNLFVLGLKTLAIFVVYMLPALLIQTIYFKDYVLGLFYNTQISVTPELLMSVKFIAIYFFVVAIMLPAAISSFLESNKIRDAFKPSKFAHIILNLEYFFSWFVVVALALAVILSLALLQQGLVLLIPQLAPIFTLFLLSASQFIVLLIALTIFSHTYSDIKKSFEGKL